MSIDATILRIAEPRVGLVTLELLLAAGLTRRQIFGRVASGLLEVVHPGVYRVSGSAATLRQRALAGCLAGGPTSFTSHTTALALHRIAEVSGEPIEITVGISRRIRVPGLNAHRSQVLGARERTHVGPLPISTPARTLIDVAGRSERDETERYVDEALRRRLLTPEHLSAEASRPEFANRPGIVVLKHLARDRTMNGRSESELETRMIQRSSGGPVCRCRSDS